MSTTLIGSVGIYTGFTMYKKDPFYVFYILRLDVSMSRYIFSRDVTPLVSNKLVVSAEVEFLVIGPVRRARPGT